MEPTIELSPDDASRIAAFTRVACAFDLLSTTSVERSVFADPDPQVVLGVFDGGLDAVAVGVVRGERGFLKLLAVHPRSRRRGMGRALLEHVERFCRRSGAATVEIGTSVPYYVVPGVDPRVTDAVCFLEELGYRRGGEAVNLGVRLATLPEPALPCRLATPDDLDAIRGWVSEHHPHWIDELTRGVALQSCVVHKHLGFACIDVNREGWFGPIATHPDARGTGVGTSTLLAALRMMRGRGHEHAEIAWAEALAFYSKSVGARVSRVFWWYRKDL